MSLDIDAVTAALHAKKNGSGWMARCPCHDDRTPSLSINLREGKVVVKCMAGCDQEEVYKTVAELSGAPVKTVNGGKVLVLQQPRREIKTPSKWADPVDLLLNGMPPSRMWVYHTASGDPAFYVARYETEKGKTIRPWVFDGAWKMRAPSNPRPLYQLHKLLRSPSAKVLVTEGEKAADAAQALYPDYIVTTWSGGAEGLNNTDFTSLGKRHVTLLPDNDEPGYKAMARLAAKLADMRCTVYQCNPPEGSADGWDIADSVPQSDWLEGAVLVHEPVAPYVSASAFLASLTAPQWVVQGIIQQTQVYALTARPNHGKTAVALYMALAIASGRAFGYADVAPGRVLYLCGEDAHGFGARILAAKDALNLPDSVLDNLDIVPRTFPMADEVDKFVTSVDRRYSAAFVDTSVAFFHGDKEDDNVQAHDHASGLRRLTNLPGSPAVVVCCHPTKSAIQDSMLPRGGSAFLGEIDCNLSLWKEGDQVTLSWHQKKRGPDFEPIAFELVERQVTLNGSELKSIVAHAITEERETELSIAEDHKQKQVLEVMAANGQLSITEIARRGGFIGATGQPQKGSVNNILFELERFKLVRRNRRGWVITDQGKEEIFGRSGRK